MQLKTHRNAVLALVTFAGLTTFANNASAQLGQIHPTVYGSTEFDTRHSQFYLLGLYVGMGGLGWSPYFNVNGYLLHNYNFGSHYVWARGRASVPFGYSARHPSRIGAEVVGQGGGLNGNTVNSFQVGPTFEYAWSPNFRTTLAGGWKNVGGSSFANRDNAAYVKLEFSASP
jgi:hypothetical protein